MKKILLIGSLVLIFAFGSFAYAQFGRTAGPRFYTEFKPVVGGWSEYQMTTKGTPLQK